MIISFFSFFQKNTSLPSWKGYQARLSVNLNLLWLCTQAITKLNFKQKTKLLFSFFTLDFCKLKNSVEFLSVHPHPEECSLYVICIFDEVTERGCVDGFSFNEEKKECAKEPTVRCGNHFIIIDILSVCLSVCWFVCVANKKRRCIVVFFLPYNSFLYKKTLGAIRHAINTNCELHL